MTWGGSYTFAGSNALSLSGAVALTANDTVTVSANTLSMGGAISGGFALAKQGPGTLVLAGANSYTGATTVSLGILNVESAAALGTVAGTTTVASGASLQVLSLIHI